jgi:hypothetical protein
MLQEQFTQKTLVIRCRETGMISGVEGATAPEALRQKRQMGGTSFSLIKMIKSEECAGTFISAYRPSEVTNVFYKSRVTY